MDTLSHGLWVTAVAKGIKIKSPAKIKVGWMALWGIIPDLFAFTPVVVWMFWQLLYNGVSFGDIPRPELMSPEERNSFFILRLSETLYHISHSFITFLVCFFLAGSVRWNKGKQQKHPEETSLKTVHLHQLRRRYTPCWEMTGWFIHVLMDIPTHSGMLYPTLFLWPLSDWYYDGNSWGTLWFMIANYSCLLIVFMLLRFVRKVKGT
jgi:hypothetical protein